MIEITDEEVRRLGQLLAEEQDVYMAVESPDATHRLNAALRMWLIAGIQEGFCRVSPNAALLAATTTDLLLGELKGDTLVLAQKFSAHLRGCVAVWEREVAKLKGAKSH